MFICEISITILICQKLGLVGPVQQNIELPSHNCDFKNLLEAKCKMII